MYAVEFSNYSTGGIGGTLTIPLKLNSTYDVL